MLFVMKCREALCSKPARTFFWLLFAIAACVFLVLLLDAIHSSEEEVLSSTVEVFPKPNKRSVIHFSYKNLDSYSRWTKKIDKALDPYKRQHPHSVDCSFSKFPKTNETCRVDVEAMAPCVHSNDYGYSKGSPCVFIKLKRVLHWTPEYLNYEEMSSAGLSRGFIDGVKDSISKTHPVNLKMIWLSCGGRTLTDREIIGKIEYLPSKGFPGYFFLYQGRDHYLEPIVAVKFVNPRTNVVIDVDCKIVAKNLNETVSFRLLVDEDAA